MSEYDLTALLDLPLTLAPGLIKHSIDKRQESLAWELWARVYPEMATGRAKFIPYADFKSKLTETKASSKTDPDEIEKEMLTLVAAYERGRS